MNNDNKYFVQCSPLDIGAIHFQNSNFAVKPVELPAIEPPQSLLVEDGMENVVNESDINQAKRQREYFSAMAMQGFLSCDHMGNTGQPPEYIARLSVEHADALIAELSKPSTNG